MPRWMEICSWPTSPYQRVNCPLRSPGYSHATDRIQPLYRQDITGSTARAISTRCTWTPARRPPITRVNSCRHRFCR
ncbi:hypothetical protein Naga_100737g1 [Nannochloropsis gaditana]|uniref:Uncharacterized protein n=1 Tax=Nannochloropsis gaditana TaxID=72520 RepID=W7TPE7_9STRA|nr:hypothetical protein Naga_100737g1 [Nannochloropsis gaditana]